MCPSAEHNCTSDTIDPLQIGSGPWHGCTVSDVDLAVSVIARRQYGTFSRQQVIDAGGSKHQIEHRLESGEWTALDRGVYALASAPGTWRRQVMASVLSKRPSIVSGASAGVLHDIAGCRPGRPEISVPRAASSRSGIAVVRRRSDFAAIQRVRVGRIPVASVAETLFDLSRSLDVVRLEGTLDDCLVRRAVDVAELEGVLDRVEGLRLPGTTDFRRVLNGVTSGYVPTASELERMLFRAIDDPRIPAVERQARLEWWTVLPHRVDAVIRAWRLILEADGRTYHTKRKDFERDRHRDNLAAAHGYRVMRFTYRVLNTDPDGVLQLVLEAGSQG